MIGTLTTSTGGIFFRPPPISTGSTSKTYSLKAAFHDVLDANPAVSLYEVLRVERTATPTEIKTAYRSLAKIYHPDASDFKQQGNGERDFIEIHNAYATLSDPASRASYDLRWSGGVRRKLGLYTVVGRRQGFFTCRRWETDQCW
ncbi:putative DnaJ domain, Chaperone J-domain superfamily [Helianthus annuus]|uniref:DnaJ domain, Chaperone J-domain superfamily n=1 Tax=Helianthus annuus TaxID=4232 RepID=A0A251T9G8_HELAN|nr:chaperone protein dnaJ 11, chloroplastic [Helianthus annuus]KAF5781330.1 putative DnaJ domain, Chaperone J-domain superfamily [Helianthus annuus]KAJ0500957.1 putative DnaJ domain, Chaperone J-domain superfamily [Helianthus annuus]KAJ0508616.1 putative DnaJ domain, Chaperone J-domain superfamily [Helianthus annuus]KAJ0516847.1 putative DnaJ domain, Chaperone J-domain superfamily [Helianthus annuus]KAJ0684852.1 putative DnaJ domain, Chaperone J-domain superfamily [Helianthus annuus]